MRVNKSFITDETGQRIASSLRSLNQALFGLGEIDPKVRARVQALGNTELAEGTIVEGIGIPEYVSDPLTKSEYEIDEPGWYLFVRISAKEGVAVTEDFVIEGYDGMIAPENGDDHVDIAIRFDVAAQTKTVSIHWSDDLEDVFTFRANDLAIRNLDYRTTFYVYDIADFATWTWGLTEDTTVQEGKNYYTKSGDVYTLVEAEVGAEIPANSYYVHTGLRFEGMTRNVTYSFDEVVDCPVTIALPDIPEDGHGAWFEIQMRYDNTYSTTLEPPTSDIKIATDTVVSQSKGINVLDLHYNFVAGKKVWRMINTHSNFADDAAATNG